MKETVSVARTGAYKVLCDVLINKAFSNISVNNTINLSIKNEADRALAVRIVYGSLKKKSLIESIISSLSSQPIESMNESLKVILLMSLYQILFLDKVPEYAIVNDAVSMTKLYCGQKLSGFTNGVLRNAIRKKAELIPNSSDFSEAMNLNYNFESWLTELLSEYYTEEQLKNIAASYDERPKLYVKVNTLKIKTEELIKLLESENIKAEYAYVPDTLILTADKNIFFSQAFKDGLFYAQDLSGIIACHALDAKSGMKAIDLCSAPGGKSYTTYVLSGGIDILCCDIVSSKLDLLKRSAMQFGFDRITTLKRDASKITDENEINKYDRVICDVPCSGLGVIGRKPEILFRLTKEHVYNLIELQKNILRTGIKMLKPGGVLLYSTCTINPKENIEVVKEVLSEDKSIGMIPIELPFELENKHPEMANGYIQFIPDEDNCDGFFAAKITKS